jgi:hypothetical protein
VRLSRDMKDTIVAKAMKDFKAAEIKQLELDVQAFANKAYEHKFGEGERVILKAGLPEIWYAKDDTLHIECEGFEYRSTYSWPGSDVFFHTRYDTLNEKLKLGCDRVFPGNSSADCTVEIEPDHPLYKEARKLVQRYVKLHAAENELREKVWALLASCNTTKQLEAAWPEAVQFLPQGIATTTALVPVGLSDQINKALGIPSVASVGTSAVRKAAATSK